MSRSPHLALAHSLVSGIVRQGDTVIDATCGNGIVGSPVFSSPSRQAGILSFSPEKF
jgi:hypothetical protein